MHLERCRASERSPKVAQQPPSSPPPPPFDPLNLWKEWAGQAEEHWNKYFNNMMGTETFAAMMGRSMEGMLAAQEQIGKQYETMLKSMNLPSRSDIFALGERLARIEERLDELGLEVRQRGGGTT